MLDRIWGSRRTRLSTLMLNETVQCGEEEDRVRALEYRAWWDMYAFTG